jgi:PmbA protein
MTDIDPTELLADLVARATRAGADAADAVFVDSRSQSITRRWREPEAVERSESADVGLRVLVGRRQAVVSSTDLASDTLTELVERAVAMARVAPEDPYCGLAPADLIARDVPTIEMFDPTEPSTEALIERAAAAEEAALSVDGVTNSEGADAGWGLTRIALAASNGFAGTYKRTSHWISASMLAGSGQAMQRDSDYSAKVFEADLDDPAAIGRSAGERAVARLNPRPVASARIPVIYDQRSARSLLGHLASAINGASVARGTSFLKDKMGERVFAPGISVIDDPHRARGFRSKPFDAEGLATTRRAVVEDGVLRSWFLDLSTARQLGLESTGHAGRGPGGPPSPGPSNLYLAPGTQSREAMIAGVERGLLVTEMMGMSVSIITGDYSRGAGGYWIENGEIAYPVSEVTVAGKLQDIFANMTPASDLEFKYGTDAPTVRVDGMTVAGSGAGNAG